MLCNYYHSCLIQIKSMFNFCWETKHCYVSLLPKRCTDAQLRWAVHKVLGSMLQLGLFYHPPTSCSAIQLLKASYIYFMINKSNVIIKLYSFYNCCQMQ